MNAPLKRCLGVAGIAGGLWLAGMVSASADTVGDGLDLGNALDTVVTAPVTIEGSDLALDLSSKSTSTDDADGHHEETSGSSQDLDLDLATGEITAEPVVAAQNDTSATSTETSAHDTSSHEDEGSTDVEGTTGAGIAAPVVIEGSDLGLDLSSESSSTDDGDKHHEESSSSSQDLDLDLATGDITATPVAAVVNETSATGSYDDAHHGDTHHDGDTADNELSTGTGLLAGAPLSIEGSDLGLGLASQSDRNHGDHESSSSSQDLDLDLATGDITAAPVAAVVNETGATASDDDTHHDGDTHHARDAHHGDERDTELGTGTGILAGAPLSIEGSDLGLGLSSQSERTDGHDESSSSSQDLDLDLATGDITAAPIARLFSGITAR